MSKEKETDETEPKAKKKRKDKIALMVFRLKKMAKNSKAAKEEDED